jgi:hypothetical protein
MTWRRRIVLPLRPILLTMALVGVTSLTAVEAGKWQSRENGRQRLRAVGCGGMRILRSAGPLYTTIDVVHTEYEKRSLDTVNQPHARRPDPPNYGEFPT